MTVTYTIQRTDLNGNVPVNLGNVQTDEHKKYTYEMDIIPFYTMDSSSTQTFDSMGVVREINLTGRYNDTIANCLIFVNNIEFLVNGNQSSNNSLFTDGFKSQTFWVKVDNFDWTWNAGTPGEITYTLKLIESSTSS